MVVSWLVLAMILLKNNLVLTSNLTLMVYTIVAPDLCFHSMYLVFVLLGCSTGSSHEGRYIQEGK